jgi:hypothetical protein
LGGKDSLEVQFRKSNEGSSALIEKSERGVNEGSYPERACRHAQDEKRQVANSGGRRDKVLVLAQPI